MELLMLGVSKGKESGCFCTFFTQTSECMMLCFFHTGRDMLVRAREYGIQLRTLLMGNSSRGAEKMVIYKNRYYYPVFR